MRLSPEQRHILAALQQGGQLKVHRTADGIKAYRLHGAPQSSGASSVETLDASAVTRLETSGLIESNMKFPAATFLLTEKGAQLASQVTGLPAKPTGPRNYR